MMTFTEDDCFDWVTARSECTAGMVFAALKEKVQQDTEKIGGIDRDHRFIFQGGSTACRVVRTLACERSPQEAQVAFELTQSGIEVVVEGERPARGRPLFTASVKMGDDGKCRLVIGGEEVKLWQISKRALEICSSEGRRRVAMTETEGAPLRSSTCPIPWTLAGRVGVYDPGPWLNRRNGRNRRFGSWSSGSSGWCSPRRSPTCG